MKRLKHGIGLFLLALAVFPPLSASCRRKPVPQAPKSPTAYRYTPLPLPPTPTLRPGQPTHPPEPAC